MLQIKRSENVYLLNVTTKNTLLQKEIILTKWLILVLLREPMQYCNFVNTISAKMLNANMFNQVLH